MSLNRGQTTVSRAGMEVVQLADAEAVSRAAAEEVVRCARGAVAARGRFTIVLSGGSTPRLLYELLAVSPFREQIDWERVEVFWGDERTVPPDHPDSNFGMARAALLAKVPVPPARVHRMAAERHDRDGAAQEYAAEIARTVAVPSTGEPPVLDLILLGMGPDGHTASLFPHTEAVRETRRWVVRNYVPKLQTDRLTLTVPILNRGAAILFLVAGADKGPVLREVLEGPPDPERLPSQLIRPTVGRLVWLVDRAAAGSLAGTGRVLP